MNDSTSPQVWITVRRLLIHIIKVIDPELKKQGYIRMTHDETIIYDWILNNSIRGDLTLKELRGKCKELKRIL